ncbi:MAG: 5'/3'-nucleotidase SurE [Spirochaetales bacterium]|nr:5'/3'-nucleotidase SurE [Spirochaetales bacterium]
MTILLTNDDGIASESMIMLKKALGKAHEVWIVAPEREMSGCSHSITTINNNIKVKKLAERVFSCAGTPADCVLLARLELVTVPIDLVISGINYGANLGTDIIYSGTVAGARQGAIMGIPSIAASLCTYIPPFYFEYPVKYLTKEVEKLHDMWVRNSLINLNFPNTDGNHLELAFTRPSIRIYEDKLEKEKISDTEYRYKITGKNPAALPGQDTDYHAVQEGKISLSLVNIYPENQDNNNKDQIKKRG